MNNNFKMNETHFDTIVWRDATRNGFDIERKGGRYYLSTTAHEGKVEVIYDENGIHIVPISPYIKDGKVVNEIILGADDINDIVLGENNKLRETLNELHKYYMNF